MSIEVTTATIPRQQAIAVAEANGVLAYGNLDTFTLEVVLEDDGWHIDYWLRKPRHAGGGPHYVNDPATGAIAFKKYSQ